tara:strand:- start:586 stop:837 length:252 start_codon:yes stop_codon:yes gene_type:complete
MSWRDIIKGQEEYDFYMSKIERLEEIIEKFYEDVEINAKSLSEGTIYSYEEAVKLIMKMFPQIDEAKKMLEELREKLEESTKD